MNTNEKNLYINLKKHFGFTRFRGLQKRVIQSLLNNENVFAVMPTGGGKSLCYQLPALMKEGMAIVVSPLIALMKNQVDVLRGISKENSIAHVLNSLLKKIEVEQVKEDICKGRTKLLYIAPESLAKDENLEFLKNQKIAFVAIDEAHCISEWGHDFRPEYRNLKDIIKKIGNVPIICLTATATPKVQEDILKTLDIIDAKRFKDSFNRPNLFYEVRPKTERVFSDIVKFINRYKNKSGVIYCMSRKKVEEVAQILQINGIKALPYHAGLNSQIRSKHQDMFLMEEIHVIVATIAFGMGIDKPDIRFVIHHDIPKSLESYYQETGRAGRDGREGYCLAYYDYRDVQKLEKFLAKKTISEREVSYALLQDVVGYAETSMSRRKYLLHYFGEDFDEVNGDGADMDDNSRNPKPKIPAEKEVSFLLKVVKETGESYKSKDIVAILMGEENAMLASHEIVKKFFFGKGKEQTKSFWMDLIRQILVAGYLKKKIEQYSILKLTQEGMDYIKNPKPFFMTKNHTYQDIIKVEQELNASQATADEQLMKMLKNLRKKIAKKRGVPPFAVFHEASLESMCLFYPTSLKKMANIYGVGEGKAKKYGKEFVELIAHYVKENEITTPEDWILKGTGQKSEQKLHIIRSIDRRISFFDIMKDRGLTMLELIEKIESIVYSGTKLDISYYLDEILEEEQQEEMIHYFMHAKTDAIEVALEAFEEEYQEEELRLVRIRFMNEVAN